MKTVYAQPNLLGKPHKTALALITCVVLSACSSSSLISNSGPFEFYLLNTQTGAYCKGYTDQDIKGPCHSLLSTVIFAQHTKAIEEIYQQELSDRTKIGNLINVILRGKNLEYPIARVAKYMYRLPINQQTDTVWDVLEKIEDLTDQND